MLIRITNQCNMLCSHCMIEGVSADGEEMDSSTFIRALGFAEVSGSKLVLISGGEPSLHSRVIDFIDLAMSHPAAFIVVMATNGIRLMDDLEFQEKILQLASKPVLGLHVQVTNDPRYYPKPIEFNFETKNHKVLYETRIPSLFPCKRTKNLDKRTIKWRQEDAVPAPEKQAPTCFNLRSATRRIGSHQTAIQYLEQHGRCCCPSIDIDGTVHAGESDTCYKIGTVSTPPTRITRAIEQMTCSKCGLVDNLSRVHMDAIGESRLVTLS